MTVEINGLTVRPFATTSEARPSAMAHRGKVVECKVGGHLVLLPDGALVDASGPFSGPMSKSLHRAVLTGQDLAEAQAGAIRAEREE